MKIEIKLRIAADDGAICEEEILSLDKPHDQLEAIGFSLAEAKDLLGRLQEHIVAAQAATFAAERRCCCKCGRVQPSKGRAVIRFRTPFGDVPISSPRLHRCGCHAGKGKTFSPLTELFSEGA